jgi:hypothetical protein
MVAKIQRVELNTFYDASIFCPFCGTKIIDYDDAHPKGVNSPCPHTLFVAHDEGFEFRSPRLDDCLGILGVDNDDLLITEDGIDGLTDQIGIIDAVKFAAYVSAPGFFGVYVGFAPLDSASH